MSIENHGVASAKQVISGHRELRYFHDPYVGQIEDRPGDGLEQQNTHHDEDQILGEFADRLVGCVNVTYEYFYCFGHNDPFVSKR
jgi:hypothetical protein